MLYALPVSWLLYMACQTVVLSLIDRRALKRKLQHDRIQRIQVKRAKTWIIFVYIYNCMLHPFTFCLTRRPISRPVYMFNS